jgi:hypothetical protein
MVSWGARDVFLTLAELNDMKRNIVSSSRVISTCHLLLIEVTLHKPGTKVNQVSLEGTIY